MTFQRTMARKAFGLGALICVALLGFALYLQHARGLEPCPLCLVQRGFFYALLILFLLGAIQNPGKRGTTVYSVLLLVFAIGGGAVATRQVWLQHLPKDRVPACGPDLFFMLKNFPLGDAISRLFAGSGECAAVDWTFLGGSIAEWSLVWFLLFAVASVLALLRLAQPRPA